MDKPRPCGCKGCRTCLICESDFNIELNNVPFNNNEAYIYCISCNKAWPGWNSQDNQHPNHIGEYIEFPGIYIDIQYLSELEEKQLISDIDSIPWDLSQSGRRKQNFGPKCNFKKRKLKLGNFNGFPISTQFVQQRFNTVPIMKGFQTIEQCSLEYNPERGASIDPHVDDCWVWGERIVTVNLLSDSVLTMTYNDKPTRYNLDEVKDYPCILNENGTPNNGNKHYEVIPLTEGTKYPVVRVPMPRRSLMIMYGAARYNWAHQVLRKDIAIRRVCIAYREFTPPFLKHGTHCEEGKKILACAMNFSKKNGCYVGTL